MKIKTIHSGFTLVELIIVIAIIAILAAAVFVAIDPAQRLNQSRNARRNSDVETILGALKMHQADNGGTYYSTVAALTAGNFSVIGTAGSGCNTTCTAKTTQAACVDLSALPKNYLGAIPFDPKTGSATNTDYYISKGTLGTLTVGACDPEGEGAGGSGTPPAIEVTR